MPDVGLAWQKKTNIHQNFKPSIRIGFWNILIKLVTSAWTTPVWASHIFPCLLPVLRHSPPPPTTGTWARLLQRGWSRSRTLSVSFAAGAASPLDGVTQVSFTRCCSLFFIIFVYGYWHFFYCFMLYPMVKLLSSYFFLNIFLLYPCLMLFMLTDFLFNEYT